MRTIWFLLVSFFKYYLLLVIICLAGLLWIVREFVLAVGHNPKAVVGTAAGGAYAVKIWAKSILNMVKVVRGYLGKYVKIHHPGVYQRLFRIFR